MVGTGGIARRGADAAIGFADEVLVAQRLVGGIGPQVGADMLVEPFGERLGKAVGERFQQDVVIIVMRGLEALEVRLEPVKRDREAAEPILLAAGR